GQVMRILSQGCGACRAGEPGLLRQALTEYGTLASIALLLLALRRMLRSRRRPQDIAWLGGLGAAGVTAGLVAGSGLLPQVASARAVAAPAVLCARGGLRGVGRPLAAPAPGLRTPPLITLAAVAVLHLLELANGRPLLDAGLPPPGRAVLWLVLSAAITLSLIALMIWRLITRIQHLMRNDALTGVSNRRAFEQSLAEQ